MFAPFFTLAALSPSRQRTFRQAVVAHLILLGSAALALVAQGRLGNPILLGHIALTAGIVEGALLVGWRLTQLPKSQALEFLLVSPLQPTRVFLAETLVGLALLTLVTLTGLPIFSLLAAAGHLDPLDLVALTVLPLTWGAITGLGLAIWAYEPRAVRKIGEMVVMGGILVYLTVGVLAGEHLAHWLDFLPTPWKIAFLHCFHGFHAHNPFGAIHFWFVHDVGHAWRTMLLVELLALVAVVLLLWRGSRRLLGHFHERHYEPARDVSAQRRPAVGDRPLSWWAVKRVSEFSGRINLWLAGGFCLLYAAYLVGETYWPAWLGRRVFQLCDAAGGVAALATVLVVLAAVPAAYQYGLWDSSVQERCRRLELLLLTRLGPTEYWDAAFTAALRRGRGYFALALLLWTAALFGGRLTSAAALASAATGVLLWSLYFALGFRAFTRGAQANGLGLLLTVGLPLAAWALTKAGWATLAGWTPPGMVYRAGSGSIAFLWLVGPVLVAACALLLTRRALAGCDSSLRLWYERNHGSKVMS